MKIFGYNLELSKVQNIDKKLPEKGNVTNAIKIQQTLYRTRQDIGTWRSALTQAENIQYPQRQNLYRLYKDVVMDAHLTACINTRKNLILGQEFIVCDNEGNVNEEKTMFLQKKWFYDFVCYALDSIYYGHSLIQFGDIVSDEFSYVELVPREYVKPEFKIVANNPASFTGINYTEPLYDRWSIGVGGDRDLGLLAKATPYVLWKKIATTAWSEYAEVFGTPIRIGKTNVRDNQTRSNMEQFLKNMGTSSYAVVDTDDIIEMIESNKSDAHEVFDMLIERCNSEISKLILGQTGTTDEKSYSGSANVHERILKQYEEADEIFIENIFKYQLVPLLNKHGFGFENLVIKTKEDNKFSDEEKAKIDMELLKYYKIPSDYIESEYGTPVEEKVKEPEEDNVKKVKNKLEKYYK